jgi:hypothetical protein
MNTYISLSKDLGIILKNSLIIHGSWKHIATRERAIVNNYIATNRNHAKTMPKPTSCYFLLPELVETRMER